MNDDGDVIGIDRGEIDLMATDDESGMDYESENDQDCTFVDDVQIYNGEEEGASFYRRFNNDF